MPTKDRLTPAMREAVAIDRLTASRLRCSVCGVKGAAFDYEYRTTPYLYRAYATCANGHVDEF